MVSILQLAHLLLAGLIYSAGGAAGLPPAIPIGGLLQTKLQERVFRYAVEYVNQKDIIGHGITLSYITNITDHFATFENIQLACDLAEQGVMAIIGPMSSTSVMAVAPVSTAFHIPLIAPAATDPTLGDKDQYPFLVRMMPPDSVQSLALLDLIEYYDWKRMVILTSNTAYGVNGLLKFQSEIANSGRVIHSVQRFQSMNSLADIDARSQLQHIADTGVRVIILHCHVLMAKEVLRQAEDMDMTGPGWAWIVTDGIGGTTGVQLEGMIGTAPAFIRGRLYPEFSYGWEDLETREGRIWEEIDVFSAMVADAVLTFAFAARDMYDDPSNDHVDLNRDYLSCDDPANAHWQYGRLLLRHISNIQEDGVTSALAFDGSLAPLHQAYDIVNLKKDGWLQVGIWDPEQRLVMSRPHEVRFMGGRRAVYGYVSGLVNRTLNVVTVEGVPFTNVMVENPNRANPRPGDIDGYCIDLLDKLAEIGGFKYNLYLVADGAYGIRDPATGHWNGVIEDLIVQKADVAVAALTISQSREKDVDFTQPYIDLGMTFVMKKPEEDPIRPFAFLDPFTLEVWLYVLSTMVLVAAAVSWFNKLSPNDYHGEIIYACNGKLEEDSYTDFKQFQRMRERVFAFLNFYNSLWFSFASLLSQGGETYPKSLSGRIISVLWWFGIVIITATYTANLTAFLTASRVHTDINSLEDLASQTKIPYGANEKSATQQFFIDSNITIFNDMNRFMHTRNTFLANDVEGLAKVRRGGYAHVTDSAGLEYEVQQEPCDLRVVGRIFGKIGYGVALQKNSPYTEELSALVLHLRESGFMDELRNKWFVARGQCGGDEESAATASGVDDAEHRLTYTNMLGVFYIIYGALAFSLVLAVVELVVKCVTAVDNDDQCMPQSQTESFRKHLVMLKKDVLEDWLPRLPLIGAFKRVAWGKTATAGQPYLGGPENIIQEVINSSTNSNNVKFAMARYASARQ